MKNNNLVQIPCVCGSKDPAAYVTLSYCTSCGKPANWEYKITMNKYNTGKQPCLNIDPVEIYPYNGTHYAEHKCCSGTILFCLNCHEDHHSQGFNTCNNMPTKRKIETHIVPGDTPDNQLAIEVVDEPGQGGANHQYDINYQSPTIPWNLKTLCQINFQNGPIGEFGVNGITEPAILSILIDRYKAFQNGPFKCQSNADALESMETALYWMQERTRQRIARNVEGTNKV